MRRADRKLIQRFLAGDEVALATVEGWLFRAAWPYRQRLSGDWPDLQQDIRTEVVRLLREDRFRGESSLKTYLWRVANHACLDRLRQRHRRRWLELADPLEPDLPPAAAPGDEPAARQETRDLLRRVLDQMPEDCRELWQMLVAGLSYREMSTRTGASEGALRVRVLRCRKKAVAARHRLLN